MPGTKLFNAEEFARDYRNHGEVAVQALLENTGPDHDGPFGEGPRNRLSPYLRKRGYGEKRDISPDDYSIAGLFEAIMGTERFQQICGKKSSRVEPLTESDAVNYGNFTNITGQIYFNSYLEGWEHAPVVFSPLIDQRGSDIQVSELIPGISDIDPASIGVVGEGDEFPLAGVSENYILIAAKKKRGCHTPVTKEAVAGDKTGELLDKCRGQGTAAALELEDRVIDCIIDENDGAASAAVGGHRYHWRDSSYASYQTSTPWINVKTSNALVNYTDVEGAWRLLVEMKHPFTDYPINYENEADSLIVTPQNKFAAMRIINSVQDRFNTNNSAGTADVETLSPNLVKLVVGQLRVLCSQRLADRAATDTDWWYGSLKGIRRTYNWDFETEELGQDSYLAFIRDVIHDFKISYKDCVSVIEPRKLVENRA